MSDIPVLEMNRDQLLAQAELLGITVSAKAGTETLRKKILIALGESAEDVAEAKTPEGDNDHLFKLVNVRIPEDRQDKSPVFIGVNGKNWLIERGKTVEIPYYAYLSCTQAQEHTFDEEGRKNGEVPSYPIQLV